MDHLVSDVPVGVFLSGGIDSSAITAFAARHYGGRLKTFSAGFDFDRGVNELPKARKVAEHFGTDHHELHVSGGDVAGVMERLVRCHDQPFGDAANIPLFLLVRAARRRQQGGAAGRRRRRGVRRIQGAFADGDRAVGRAVRARHVVGVADGSRRGPLLSG